MIKVLVIGAKGRIAQQHLRIFRNAPWGDFDVKEIDLNDSLRNMGWADWVVIATPTDTHYSLTKFVLEHKNVDRVVVEKPLCLPWEPIIDDPRIRVVLQLRWIPLEYARGQNIKVTFVRDQNYFMEKGDIWKTGGVLWNLFIHYIDLAYHHRVPFEGIVLSEGKQDREIMGFDLEDFPQSFLYEKMYEDIYQNGGGVLAKEMFHLHWVMSRMMTKVPIIQKTPIHINIPSWDNF